MLSYSMLPVHAWNPATCEHLGYFSSIDPVATGAYDYREDAHYAEYGVANTCVKCRQEFFTDTYFKFDSYHVFGGATIVLDEYTGTAEIRYYCVFNGCPWYRIHE